MDNIVIVGSSGHAKVIVDIVQQEGKYKIAGLLDRYRKVDELILSLKQSAYSVQLGLTGYNRCQ